MEKIFITEDKLQELNVIGNGKEGIVYEYDEHTAIKIFNKEVDLDSKMKKIYLLHDTPIQFFATIPEKIVNTPDGSGYSMEYKKNYLAFSDLGQLKKKRKIELLKQAKTVLETLHKDNKIVVGDVRCENILTRDNHIVFCDTDNFKINNINPELLNIYGKYYVRKYDSIDEGLDIFSFNIMSLLFLLNSSKQDIIDYILNTEKIENVNIRNMFMRVLNEEEFTKNYIVDDLFINKTKRKLY
jgi:hypothetical protein